MLARLSIGQQFYSWVNSQDPGESYFWPDRRECACGRYLQEVKGFSVREITPDLCDLTWDENGTNGRWFSTNKKNCAVISEIWRFNKIAQGGYSMPKDWTFGALAKRIREQRPECVV